MRADPQIGRRNDSAQIDETPILGRKVTSLPLLNSAFRQGKGTGDLFVNATYFVTGGGSRRTTTFMLDGASNDEGWGRQTMIATVPVGAIQEIAVLSNAFSAEFGWTAGPALNIVTKSGTNDAARRGAVHGAARQLAGEHVRDHRLLRAVGPDLRHADDADGDQPGGRAGRAEPVLRHGRRAVRQGQDVLLRHRRLHDAGSDDVPLEQPAVVRDAGGRQHRPTSGTTARRCSTGASITRSRRGRR